MRRLAVGGLVVIAALAGASVGQVGAQEREARTQIAHATLPCRAPTVWTGRDAAGPAGITASTPEGVMARFASYIAFKYEAQEERVNSDLAVFLVPDGNGGFGAHVVVRRSGAQWHLSSLLICIPPGP
jgi:hypothetical protein